MIITTEILSRADRERGRPKLVSQSARESEKFSEAKALPRNPDNVIAIWMVERNFSGWLVSRRRRAAFLFPCSAIFSSFVSLKDRTAISALAKIAFSASIINWISNKKPMESPKIKTSLSYIAAQQTAQGMACAPNGRRSCLLKTNIPTDGAGRVCIAVSGVHKYGQSPECIIIINYYSRYILVVKSGEKHRFPKPAAAPMRCPALGERPCKEQTDLV